jgi:CUB/sushi domain-containing protein
MYVSVAVIDCGSLEPPANGGVELSNTILGSQANYSCNPLFTLVGSETRICMENREWTPDAPTCERKYKV